jgi:hypothetical protein
VSSTLAMAGNNTSVPVKTDGLQILSASITPFAATNKLLVRCVLPVCPNIGAAAANTVVALFQDTTTAAVAAIITGSGAANVITDASLVVNLTANTTGPTTFKLNVANLSATSVTWVVNGNSVGTALGGAMRASIVIQETKV